MRRRARYLGSQSHFIFPGRSTHFSFAPQHVGLLCTPTRIKCRSPRAMILRHLQKHRPWCRRLDTQAGTTPGCPCSTPPGRHADWVQNTKVRIHPSKQSQLMICWGAHISARSLIPCTRRLFFQSLDNGFMWTTLRAKGHRDFTMVAMACPVVIMHDKPLSLEEALDSTMLAQRHHPHQTGLVLP